MPKEARAAVERLVATGRPRAWAATARQPELPILGEMRPPEIRHPKAVRTAAGGREGLNDHQSSPPLCGHLRVRS
jgi:hypothetical protein